MAPANQQAYLDYVEFHDGQAATRSAAAAPTPSKSKWVMAATAALLVGASVAYTGSVDTTAFKWPWQKPTATDSNKQYTPVAKPAVPKEATVLIAQPTEKLGNKVVLTFPNSPIKDGTLTEGILSVAEWARQSPPPTVEMASQGLRCSQYTFSFTATTLQQKVWCRTVAGSVSAAENGQVVTVPVTFSYPYSPICNAESQTIERQKQSSGRCSAWGDPHLTTFDGVAYDFQPDGVFRYLTTRGLDIQVFQEKCPPSNTGKASAPSCYQAVAISYADSVLRLYLQDNKISIVKGSDSTRWFELYKYGGNTEGYRIFLLADDTSYIDITVGVWVMNYGYINIAVNLSPFFKDPSILGLMGNWNGNAADDSRDVAALTQQNRYPLDTNLFVCSDCSKWTRTPTESDELARKMRVASDNTRQGFTLVDESAFAIQQYTPTFRTVATAAMVLQAIPDLSARATSLCTQVITEIPLCDKYVTNRKFFIENVCIADAVLVNDLSVVDKTKIAYLRECRRELEARIIGEVGNFAAIAALTADRDTLDFGELSLCPQSCNGQGQCLAAACECNEGYTGYACTIKI